MARMDHQALANLHDCLQPPESPELADDTVTVRLKPSTKSKLKTLCERHGVDMSTFFRQCAERVTTEVG